MLFLVFGLVKSIYLSTIVFDFHDGPAVPQPHEAPHSHAAPVFGLALRLGHEEEAEWSLGESRVGREEMRERVWLKRKVRTKIKGQ